MKSNGNFAEKLVIALFVVILLFVLLFFGIDRFEKLVIQKADDELIARESNDSIVQRYVYFNNKKYVRKNNIKTFLVIGIDKTGEMTESESYNNNEQSDYVTLLVINDTTMYCDIIQFNRDTMVDIPVLTVSGKSNQTKYAQLALAHTYGNGADESCRNTVDTVENLIFDTDIDHYICFNMSAVAAMNDEVGGVKVKVLQDFGNDKKFVKGSEILLKGNDALKYVRARKDAGNETNVDRMKRQKQYMTAFFNKFKLQYAQDNNLPVKLFQATEKYFISDTSFNEFNTLSTSLSKYQIGEIIIPKGEAKYDKEFAEFYIDDDALKNTVIDLFYDEVPEG